jgi:hypothetical protein
MQNPTCFAKNSAIISKRQSPQCAAAVSLRSGRGHGLTTNAVEDWTRTGHGQTVVAENSCSRSWKNRGKFLAAAWTYSVDFPGRCREIARLLCGCCAGRHTGCGADCDGICQVTCEQLCQLWCGHSSASCGTLPANYQDTSRLLPGNCPDDSVDATADTARTLRLTPRLTPRLTLRGLRRQLRSHLPTIVPTLVRTLARTFTGAW